MNKGEYKMDMHAATEFAYKNGYNDGFAAGVRTLEDLLKASIRYDHSFEDICRIIERSADSMVIHE